MPGAKIKITPWLLTDTYAMAKNHRMNLSVWCGKSRGRQAALAEHLRVRPPVVAGWLSGRRPVPVKYGALIEAFTFGDVARKDLWPATWHLIWPELVGADGAPECPTEAVTAEQEVANG